MNITGMSDQWVAALIKQKGDSKCIPWKSLKDLILTHPDVRKRVDVFALSIYGLVVFLKALGHVDEAVTDLFEQFDKRVTPIPIILVKTFRSLSTYRKAGSYRGETIFQRKNGWQFFRIFKKRTSSGELLGCFRMRSCIDVVILIGFHCLEFGELLDMPYC
ncbi:hypothetical protein Godav_025973 [Gossypium davidsonii]|uniref:Uncharacterized protein n=1 Tax=Gossypium davidsonii TaxID=34287 RepID=A0A7J8TAY2_GOSDV|nr:hypothetical protein [Gossypium davidsonii]